MWIGVMDRCMGTLKVGLKNNEFIQTLEPSSQVHLKATGDAEATVGLVAVDKAVYVLNSKPRLTQKKVWDTVEEHDSGCTADSGRDRIAVFKGAGLHLKVSTGMYTPASSDGYESQSTAVLGSKPRRASCRRDNCTPSLAYQQPDPAIYRGQSPSLRSLKILETKRNAGGREGGRRPSLTLQPTRAHEAGNRNLRRLAVPRREGLSWECDAYRLIEGMERWSWKGACWSQDHPTAVLVLGEGSRHCGREQLHH
ncbi:venom factor-like isoform X6 [Ictidomys tridecemlineatus]